MWSDPERGADGCRGDEEGRHRRRSPSDRFCLGCQNRITDRLTCFVNEDGASLLVRCDSMRTEPAPGRRRINDPGAMRDRILDAAYRCFVERGYHATATHDILDAAGVTSGALHHHFPTKKKLGMAVIRERVGRAVEEGWIAPVERADLAIKGALTVMARIGKELKANGKVRGCPLNNLAMELAYVDPEFRSAAQEIFSRWTLTLAARLRADQRNGWRPDLDPTAVAHLLVAAYSGAMAMAKAEQSERPLTVARKILEAQFA